MRGGLTYASSLSDFAGFALIIEDISCWWVSTDLQRTKRLHNKFDRLLAQIEILLQNRLQYPVH